MWRLCKIANQKLVSWFFYVIFQRRKHKEYEPVTSVLHIPLIALLNSWKYCVKSMCVGRSAVLTYLLTIAVSANKHGAANIYPACIQRDCLNAKISAGLLQTQAIKIH